MGALFKNEGDPGNAVQKGLPGRAETLISPFHVRTFVEILYTEIRHLWALDIRKGGWNNLMHKVEVENGSN